MGMPIWNSVSQVKNKPAIAEHCLLKDYLTFCLRSHKMVNIMEIGTLIVLCTIIHHECVYKNVVHIYLRVVINETTPFSCFSFPNHGNDHFTLNTGCLIKSRYFHTWFQS